MLRDIRGFMRGFMSLLALFSTPTLAFPPQMPFSRRPRKQGRRRGDRRRHYTVPSQRNIIVPDTRVAPLAADNSPPTASGSCHSTALLPHSGDRGAGDSVPAPTVAASPVVCPL